MTSLVPEKKSQSRLVARFPEKEFDDAVSPIAEVFGGPQLFVERLVRWFIDQPPELQAMIQGQVPATPDMVRLVLKRLSESKSGVAGTIKLSPNARGKAAGAHKDTIKDLEKGK